MNPVPAFPSVADAMAAVQAGLRFVAAADATRMSAAKAGMDLRDLAGLAAEMYERSRPDLPDEDPARRFEDRAVHLETTFQGAGVLNGDLTPECAAVVGAVLDALGAPAGAEMHRDWHVGIR